jgi:hypothetical protein
MDVQVHSAFRARRVSSAPYRQCPYNSTGPYYSTTSWADIIRSLWTDKNATNPNYCSTR